MIPKIQEFIHQLEVGAGARWLRWAVGLMAVCVLAGLHLVRDYRNLEDPAAMDAAQVARQLVRGEGFTTRLIRPLSVHLLETRAAEVTPNDPDPGRLRSPHPDLANPPLYPLVLAAGLGLGGGGWEAIPAGQVFRIYPPDRWVVLINYVLLAALVMLTFALGQRLFDGFIGLLAALALAGSALLWRLAASGQATVLAALMVLLVACGIVLWDAAARAGRWGTWRLAGGAGVLGMSVGLAGLTQYALLLLILPVAAILFPGWLAGRRWGCWGALFLGFGLVVVPWVSRNYQHSGHWFGTAPAVLVADTASWPGDSLERSLEEPLDRSIWGVAARKAGGRLVEVVQNDLPTLGGSWVAALFLVGLLFRFSDPTREVLRLFVVMGLVVLVPVQAALGPGSAETSVWKGTQYLVVFAPLVFLLGAALFGSLLEHVDWPVEGIRPLVIGCFGLIALMPVVLALLRQPPAPQVFPPYHPPFIQRLADWTDSDEIVMTDVPWAVAWYGDRSAVWLTLDAVGESGREDFFAFNDFQRAVAGLYLTQITTDARFFSEMEQPFMLRNLRQAQSESAPGVMPEAQFRPVRWPEFAYRSLGQRWLPPGFPLRFAHAGLATSGHLLMMARRRWQNSAAGQEGLEAETE